MKSNIRKYTVVLSNETKSSISIEPQFLDALREISGLMNMPVAHLVRAIDNRREHNNLSSAVRLHVLKHYKDIADLATGGGRK